MEISATGSGLPMLGETALSDATNDKKFFKLRSYQDELLEESLKRNTIIALDTGSGKTHIAIARARVELESCSPEKLVWFLAPTVALCQQHSVTFDVNLPAYQLRVLSGEDEVDRWTNQTIWDAALKNIRIVISSYAVLLDALSHGFVTMERLALCIFDEAHHCMKKHPANQIMQLFYLPAKRDGKAVPHILGLSASPVTNARAGGLELLENNLDSHAITPRLQRSELMQYVHIPELIKLVHPSSAPELSSDDTSICSALSDKLRTYDITSDPYVLELSNGNGGVVRSVQLEKVLRMSKTYCIDQLKGLLLRAEVIQRDVGTDAADAYIKACYGRIVTGIQNSNGAWMPELSDKEKIHIAAVLQEVCTSASGLSMSTSLAPKSQLLIETLLKEAGPSFTGIIFVEQRALVAALAELITTHPETSAVFKVGTFVGNSNSSKRKGSVGDLVEPKQQQNTLDDFRIGKKNLIIATSVLEEGIDVSSCQTVICFDPPKNLISFLQRRGRARRSESRYIVLLAEGDAKSEPTKWHELEAKMKAAYMDDLRNAQLAAELENIVETDDRQYSVPSTGALLTLSNANQHLYHFCATLQTSGHVDLRPTFWYRVDANTQLITAEVVLPLSVHPSVCKATSTGSWKTERAAMADAAFQAYTALHRHGLVNDNLLPLRAPPTTGPDDIPGGKPSLVAVAERWSPWAFEHVFSPCIWSTTFIDISIGGQAKAPLCVLIPRQMPPIPDIPLHWSSSIKGIARIIPDPRAAGRLSIDSTGITDRAALETLALFTSSLPPGRVDDSRTNFAARFLFAGSAVPDGSSSGPQMLQELINAGTIHPDIGLIEVKGQIGKKFLFKELIPITPSIGTGNVQTILDKSTGSVRVTRFPKNRDFVRAPQHMSKEDNISTLDFPIADCTVDAMPASHAFSAACIPSILYHIENYLVAFELQQTILHPVGITGLTDLSLILEATTSGAADPIRNYERLEYLGDTILKFCTHVQLSAQHPTWPEGYLTQEKSRTNGNASLSRAALNTGLEEYITTKPFSASQWRPSYLSTHDEAKTVQRSTKTLADVVEALIGASFISTGLEGALECISFFLFYEIWYPAPESLSRLSAQTPTTTTPNPPLLEHLIGYTFKNPNLLREATTHASFHSSSTEPAQQSYDRLEFLGDAVLDFLLVPKLFANTPKLKNHEMHRLRQALANAHILAFLCMRLSAPESRTNIIVPADPSQTLLQHTARNVTLADFVRVDFNTAQGRAAAVLRFEKLAPGIEMQLREGDAYPWADLIAMRAPKMFCDVVEAVLGAIFVDSGGDVVACEGFLEKLGVLGLMRRFLGTDESERALYEKGGEQGEMGAECSDGGGRGGKGSARPDVAFPKETLGLLADKKTVVYAPVLSSEGWGCAVEVGDECVCVVDACASREEAEVRGAEVAVSLLKARNAGEASDGKEEEMLREEDVQHGSGIEREPKEKM